MTGSGDREIFGDVDPRALERARRDAEIYASAYNRALTQGFEAMGTEFMEQAYLSRPEALDEIQNMVLNFIQGWDARPLEGYELDEGAAGAEVQSSLSAAELFERYNHVESPLYWAFVYDLTHRIDGVLPDDLKMSLAARADETREHFYNWIEAADWGEDMNAGASSELQVAVNALQILAEWKDTSRMEAWLGRYAKIEQPAPLWSEAIVDYCAALPEDGLVHLLRFLEDPHAEAFSVQGREYLLVAATEAMKNWREELSDFPDPEAQARYDMKSDEVYKLLRKHFLQREPRVIAAICLGDLGHPRAIPLLRSYVERHEKDIDRQLYYEILSSIKRLGGTTDGLPDPFKDFSQNGAGGAGWPYH